MSLSQAGAGPVTSVFLFENTVVYVGLAENNQETDL